MKLSPSDQAKAKEARKTLESLASKAGMSAEALMKSLGGEAKDPRSGDSGPSNEDEKEEEEDLDEESPPSKGVNQEKVALYVAKLKAKQG